MYDVAIIGAGVSGAAIARRLSRYKLHVALLERCVDVSFGVSKANSGIIHAGFHHSPASLKARLEIEGNRAFDGLQAELGFPFRRVGIVVAAFSVEEMKTVDHLYAQGVENGARDVEIVGRDRLLALEPALSRDVAGGLFAPSGGIIEPYRFVFALAESAAANGVHLFTGWELAGAQRHGDAWHLVSSEGGELAARWVVNAAGLRADAVSDIFGAEHFTIVPRKGEEFILDKGSAGPPSRVIFPVPARSSKGVLVIPTVEGTVMLGPTADEGGDKEDTTTTPENLDRVFRLASQMVPRISKRDIITSFAGLRPTLPGDDFMIELSRAAPCLVHVAGIQSPGLTASPAIAERVKKLLKSGGLSLVEKTEWQPGIPRMHRTRDHALWELDRLVARDPAYAHLVCRCEGVSEAEVVEAISKGHTTLDGIKYYTRAGMGRCQGGFCTYRIMRLVARETGLPLERITKHGPGSELVMGRIGGHP
ncbi:MAG: NAD(P)/FAD-dependent oxidoreductase [Spirochaetia bacterium]